MLKTVILSLTFLVAIQCNIQSSKLDFGTHEQVTSFIMERFNVNGKSEMKEESKADLESLYSRHFLNGNQFIRTDEYQNEIIDHAESKNEIHSKVKNKAKNSTLTADTLIDTQKKILFNVVRNGKEEKLCLVISLNSTMNNTVSPSTQYSVDTKFYYASGIEMKLFSADRNEASTFGIDDDEDLNMFKFIRAKSKTLIKKRVSSEHLKEKQTVHGSVSATAVIFPQSNCLNSKSFECGTLARVYHHINTKFNVDYNYKDRKIAYDAENHGTIVTVVKKPKN